MGCGNSKEKLENEMIKLKFQRAQIQMERKNQIKLLEGIEKKKITEPIIPDFISFEPEKPSKKLLTETKSKKDLNNKEKDNKNQNEIENKKRNKSVKIKNKNKKQKAENLKAKKKENIN